MTRYFNTEGICRPEEHYMIRLDARLKLIKEQYVDRGKYFVINRGRQYGKTTTLRALEEYLKDTYVVISLDFQMLSTANFSDERIFAAKFIGLINKMLSKKNEWMEVIDVEIFHNLVSMKDREDLSMDVMFEGLSELCETSNKPIVLMIDEVDSASNHQVFIDFLALLRGYYLNREYSPIFQSVILAGVYDIKNLKSKMRSDAEHQYNSPWNIAADFDVDMSFSAGQIQTMLEEYEADHHTGMDVGKVTETICQYTSGYPYLVSAICKIMDEKLPFQEDFANDKNIWTAKGVEEAVRIILNSRMTLFDSMMKHIHEYSRLKKLLHIMLFQGEQVAYNADHHVMELACMFGYVVSGGTYIHVSNRIFEMRLYNLFLSEEELSNVMGKFLLEERMAKQKTGIDRRFYSVGIDGCRGGWITAVICNGELNLRRFASLKEMADELPFDACLIDMVIGLQGNVEQVRPDGMARKILKGRASTVFPAPCRKAVYEETKERRLQANMEVLHKRFSSQADAIIPKMREVDEFLQSNIPYKNHIQESHPEVCFARLKGEVLLTSKHKAEGIKERLAVLSGYLPEVTEEWLTENAKKMKCSRDDITDAVCLAIVANLSMQGKTETIPPEPVMDHTGLLMQMVIPKDSYHF